MSGISKKSFLFLFTSILSLALLLFFVIFPAISEIKNTTNDLNSQEESLTMKSLLGQNIDKNIKELDKIKKSNEIAESFIPQGSDLNFILELEGNAEKLGIKQEIIPIDSPKSAKSGEEKKIVINLKLQGNYPSLLQYLSFLEQSKYYITIESLNIKSDKNSNIASRNIISSENDDNYTNQQLIFSIKATAYRR